ncbi:prepilin peptidase [Planctomycetota bacterium]
MSDLGGNHWGIIIVAALIAAICDLRTGKIPNMLTLPLAVLGLGCSMWTNGLGGLAVAVITMLILAAPYFFMFALGHGGGGDVKMMGAIGTWLGLRQGLVVLAAVAIVGGLLALLRMATLKQRRTHFGNLFSTLYVVLIALGSGRKGWTLLKANHEEQNNALTASATVPYGVAMFLGVCISAGLVSYEVL